MTEQGERWVLIEGEDGDGQRRYGVLDRAEVWATLWVTSKQIAARTVNQRRKKYPWPDDDEIRMPMEPGIPGVGVVVSAGPRPELVIERDVSSIDCERCGRYIELDEHEGDLCNDCRAKQPGEAT